MALTDLATVQQIPGSSVYTSAYLTTLIAAADASIKKYLKRSIEQATFLQYYNGNGQVDLVLYQRPVVKMQTTVAAGSNGAALPQATINVASTAGFPTSGMFTVQSGITTYASITYTGVTSTTFTGCTGGVGTLVTGYPAWTPTVWSDSNGRGGESIPVPLGAVGPFADATLMVLGSNFMVILDGGSANTSVRGLLRRTGGGGGNAAIGWYSEMQYPGGGKLAAGRRAVWPIGDGNIKVFYSAGYPTVPADLQYAASTLVMYMARQQQYAGLVLTSEGWEGYSYGLTQLAISGKLAELAGAGAILARYRESSW